MVSTAPVHILAKLVQGSGATAHLARFRYRPMAMVNMKFRGRGLLPDVVNWIPDRQRPFFRLTEATRSMPWLAPEGKTIVTVDIGCEVGDPLWKMADELGAYCLGGWRLYPGLRQRYLGCAVLRTPIAHPIFFERYEADRLALGAGSRSPGCSASAGTASSPTSSWRTSIGAPCGRCTSSRAPSEPVLRRPQSEMRGSETRALRGAGLLCGLPPCCGCIIRDRTRSGWTNTRRWSSAKLPLAEIPAAALRRPLEPSLTSCSSLRDRHFRRVGAALRLLSALAGAVTVPLWSSFSGASEQSAGAAVSVPPLWRSVRYTSGTPRRPDHTPCSSVSASVPSSVSCEALRTGRLAWLGFAGLSSLAILTHVVGLLFPLLGWLWAVRRGRGAAVLRPLLAATLAIVLATAPFGYRLTHAVSHARARARLREA